MDMSRVSVWSGALTDRSPEKAMEVLASIGYKKIDLLEKLPHLSLFPDECDPAALKAAAEAHGLQIANLATYPGGGLDGRTKAWLAHSWQVPNPERFTGCGFSSDDPAELERELEQLYRAVDLAVFFGSRSIRVVAGNDDPETLDKIVPWFQRGAEYAAERNIFMCFENHNANAYWGLGTDSVGIAGQPELCVELVEKVGSPYFGVLYEPHNLMAEAVFDYRTALEIMKDHIVHCHFKDGAPTGDGYPAGDGYGLTPMGEGEIDFPWIVEQLDAVGYDGDFTLEYEIHTAPSEAGLKQFYEAFAAMG
jgi:sugar phosphate isomerase/epimerase